MKKDLYAILYMITAAVTIGAVAYYIFFVQADVIKTFNNDSDYITYSARQEMHGQRIAKAAVGMGYSNNERNFKIFQAELGRIVPDWRQVHQALAEGDAELGLEKPSTTDEYEQLQENLRFFYNEMNTNATNLLGIEYSTNERDVNYISLRSSIEAILVTSRKYQIAVENITDWLNDNSKIRKSGFDLIEKVVLVGFFGIILLQGLFIVRPLVKLAGQNFLSANKAYVELKGSEKKLRVSYAKQKHINKQLIVSRKELESKNSKLQESESKLLKSTEEQIAINEQLIQAQEALNNAYAKLQNSETEIRELADKQLEDNEKLFLAEKKMKQLLEEEKNAKTELNNALENLKGAQSQLVHSEKMASLGQLTAGIAHEINNPVNFISSGMSSLKMSIDALKEIVEEYARLDDGDDPSEVVESIKELKEDHEYDELMEELDDLMKDVNYGVTRTIEIVKGLRVFSRLDEEEVKKANINENLDATLVLLRNKTKNRVKVSKYYEENMSQIDCYPGQLNQVFMNILNNGIQAIPEDRKDGEIKLYTEETEDSIIVRLTDNGVGIPEKIKNRIWEPFFTTKAVGVGTGLGMSITYGIIEKHKGRIELNSEEGKGTEFAIYLPKKFQADAVSTGEVVASSGKS
ncbi:MAG: ATP-binding protein [Cytophagales bacterium]|nr:ATP-binding protein [Cytophagales bacterium]